MKGLELSSLRSRPPRLSESDGGQAQLECWNTGMLEYWVTLSSFTLFRTSSRREGGKLGFWFIRKIHLDMGGNMSKNENSPLKSTFHYSTIPLFHVWGKKHRASKNLLISASCTNSETFN
jgi:hypothetical protein